MQADRYVRHPKPMDKPPGATTESGPGGWRGRYALGLPEGSVRALLALTLFGTIWGLLVLRPDQALPGYLRDLLFIILGHYFAARKQADSDEERTGPPPLFLPRGTVRLLLIGGFVVVAARLYAEGALDAFPDVAAGLTLILVGGFLLGVILSRVRDWLVGEGKRPARWFEDFKALLALAAAGLLAALAWDPVLPEPLGGLIRWLDTRLGPEGPQEILAAVIGFYFGTRS